MIQLTFIARCADGLPLVGYIDEDNKPSEQIIAFQNKAKQLVNHLTPTSPSRGSFTAGSHVFHYLLDQGVCYLILADLQFSRVKAFGCLEAIQSEFQRQHGAAIHTVARPYAFLEFDQCISKTLKVYTDSRSSNLNQLNVALQDVQRIMVRNIDDVLQRGEALSGCDQGICQCCSGCKSDKGCNCPQSQCQCAGCTCGCACKHGCSRK